MPLISNQLDGLYGGVNQQSAEQRLSTQVEEMINAYPTLDRGLLKRNPTKKLDTSSGITFTDNMWSYEYDRGLSEGSEEKFTINISDGSMEIINVLTGKVYKNSPELVFEGTAEDYLYPFSGTNGYAATTVKDTTFIVNKSMIPKQVELTSGATVFNSLVIDMFNTSKRPYAPYTDNPFAMYGAPRFNGATTTFVIDGISINIDTTHSAAWALCFVNCPPTPTPTTYASYSANVYRSLAAALGGNYSVLYNANSDIVIARLDGAAITGSYDIVPISGTLVKTDYIASIANSTISGDLIIPSEVHLKTAYVWIESNNPASPYEYTLKVTTEDLITKVYTVTGKTTTTAVAADFATQLTTDFTVTAVGSVVRIISSNNVTGCDISDTYGNQASSSWTYKVQNSTDLPKNLGFDGAVVKVIGEGDSSFASYWLEYRDSIWQETVDPSYNDIIDTSTMPHILVRNADDTFVFKEYDQWVNANVGDIDSNPAPSFIQSETNGYPVIKDVFFFKNRLGFMTSRTISMSEVGKYGNFWRTTTAAVLDSDYIDATVDTTKVISLEYATYLEDSMMLFSDKAQFKLEGGRVLSPKDIQISQTSAYEINTNVRPLFMNDKIFFCTTRGEYSAIMQYGVKETNTSSEAVDISAHIQTYIPKNVTKLTGSPINNMLFLTSGSDDDSIWVYKYYDSGNDRVQSAWFKWTYNGKIYRAFSLGRNINIMINRKKSVAITNWIVGSGVWDMSKLWDSSQTWVMDTDSLVSQDQFEISPIFPQSYASDFLDDFTTVDNETIIPTVIKIGEWVSGSKTGKDIRGKLKFKTVQISSEEGSEFNLQIDDIKRETTRTIKSKYTVNRKPMVYGDSNNIRISILNSSEVGFRINTVSYEGALTKRDSKR